MLEVRADCCCPSESRGAIAEEEEPSSQDGGRRARKSVNYALPKLNTYAPVCLIQLQTLDLTTRLDPSAARCAEAPTTFRRSRRPPESAARSRLPRLRVAPARLSARKRPPCLPPRHRLNGRQKRPRRLRRAARASTTMTAQARPTRRLAERSRKLGVSLKTSDAKKR